MAAARPVGAAGWRYICNCFGCLFSLVLASLDTGVAGAYNVELGCASVAQLWLGGADACADGLGYRDGRCNECDCCPSCWSCAELYHYECAERNGLEVETQTVDLGPIFSGTEVSWSVKMNGTLPAVNVTGAAHAGWLQCASFPALPPGLTFDSDGTLQGTVEDVPAGFSAGGNKEAVFMATNTDGWAQTGTLRRVEIRYRLAAAAAPAPSKEQSEASDEAHTALQRAYRAYQQWESQQLSHPECVKTMVAELANVKAVLDTQPRLGGGQFWGWLGGLHMNVHKLMANVLLECELYLGLALLFPSPAVNKDARQNLDGCLAKRKLEAAKFMWMRGLSHMSDGAWAKAEPLLQAATLKKDGWGWGVNNGEIWVALGAVQIVQWGENMSSATGTISMSNLDTAESTLQLAESRQSEHSWTQLNLRTLRDLRQLASQAETQRGLGALSARLNSFKQTTKDWSENMLMQVQPNPRPAKLPSTPWTTGVRGSSVQPLAGQCVSDTRTSGGKTDTVPAIKVDDEMSLTNFSRKGSGASDEVDAALHRADSEYWQWESQQLKTNFRHFYSKESTKNLSEDTLLQVQPNRRPPELPSTLWKAGVRGAHAQSLAGECIWDTCSSGETAH